MNMLLLAICFEPYKYWVQSLLTFPYFCFKIWRLQAQRMAALVIAAGTAAAAKETRKTSVHPIQEEGELHVLQLARGGRRRMHPQGRKIRPRGDGLLMELEMEAANKPRAFLFVSAPN